MCVCVCVCVVCVCVCAYILAEAVQRVLKSLQLVCVTLVLLVYEALRY